MKGIISHDVDHLTLLEHWKDLTVPKFLARALIQKLNGSITTRELAYRFIQPFINNKLHNLEEIIKFDKSHGIPSTFFVGVAQGLGLSYPISIAAKWIHKIEAYGFDVGVHGIAFDNPTLIDREYALFKKITINKEFGIRIHYLRRHPATLEYLSRAGYIFDSTVHGLIAPYKIGNLIEFPLHIMDINVLNPTSQFRMASLKEAIETTCQRIDQVHNNNIHYLTILLHDCYFSNLFSVYRDWYCWTIEYLEQNGIMFVSYRDSLNEIKDNPNLLSEPA